MVTIGSGIVQICHIVEDLDQAVDHWVETFGAGPFFGQRNLDIPVMHRGTPSFLYSHVALGQCGMLQMELVQIVGNEPTVYRDMYPDGGSGFHHVAMFVDDLQKEIDAYAAAGSELGALGEFNGCGFAYVDTRKSVGFFTELYEECAFMRGFYRKIADAAAGWDGTRRMRSFEEVA